MNSNTCHSPTHQRPTLNTIREESRNDVHVDNNDSSTSDYDNDFLHRIHLIPTRYEENDNRPINKNSSRRSFPPSRKSEREMTPVIFSPPRDRKSEREMMPVILRPPRDEKAQLPKQKKGKKLTQIYESIKIFFVTMEQNGRKYIDDDIKLRQKLNKQRRELYDFQEERRREIQEENAGKTKHIVTYDEIQSLNAKMGKVAKKNKRDAKRRRPGMGSRVKSYHTI